MRGPSQDVLAPSFPRSVCNGIPEIVLVNDGQLFAASTKGNGLLHFAAVARKCPAWIAGCANYEIVQITYNSPA